MQEQTQNTKEWLLWRLKGIGASDAPIIMGKSKFKTKRQLWNEKFHKILDDDDEKNTFIQDKGHRLEAWARPGFEFKTGLKWGPALFTHQNFEFLRASLDGWNSQVLEGWECKLMGKDIYNILKDETLTDLERIPPQYLDQICQQFFVTGARAITLTGIMEYKDENETKLKESYDLRIERNEVINKYIKITLVPALFEFWESVQKGIEPTPSDADILEIEDEKFKALLSNYAELTEKEKTLKEKAKKESDKIIGTVSKDLKKVRDKIEKSPLRNHKKMICDGFKLTEVAGSKKVDYEAALNAFFDWIKNLKTAEILDQRLAINSFPDEPSLEKYTTAGKSSIRILVPKAKKEEIGESVIETIKEPEKEVRETHKQIDGKIFPKQDDFDMVQKSKIVLDHCEKENIPVNDIKMAIVKPAEKLAEWKGMTMEQQAIQANSNAFKNPNTKKKPRGWDNKTRAERVKYLRQTAKKDTNEISKKIMLDLADQLENLG